VLSVNNITSITDISTAVVKVNEIQLLQVLHMWGNGLTAQEAPAISDMMNCLEQLDISNNRLGDDGAVELSKGIAKKGTLKVLKISYNGITEKGAEAIADSLQHNNSLKVLRMNKNALGTKAVCKMVTNNNMKLEELSLNGDDTIDEKSVMKILDSLHINNQFITTLWLTSSLTCKDTVRKKIANINSTRIKET